MEEKYSPEEVKKLMGENLYLSWKLFQVEKYARGLRTKDKFIYAIIEEKWRLTQKSDSKGKYIDVTRQEIADVLHMNIDVVARAIKKLVNIGLIEDVRQGLGRPNRIYLLDYTPLPM